MTTKLDHAFHWLSGFRESPYLSWVDQLVSRNAKCAVQTSAKDTREYKELDMGKPSYSKDYDLTGCIEHNLAKKFASQCGLCTFFSWKFNMMK